MKYKPRTGEPNYTTCSISLSPNTVTKLKKVASMKNWSFSYLVDKVLSKYASKFED